MEKILSRGTRIYARKASLILILLSAAAPMISLFCRVTGTRLGAGFKPMAAGSALCFLVLSYFFIQVVRHEEGPREHKGALYAGAAVAVYGFLVFMGWLTSLPVNPETYLFLHPAFGGNPAGKTMAPATGFLFLVAGFSLASLILGLPRNRRAATYLTLSGFAGVFAAMAGGLVLLYYYLGKPLHGDSLSVPLSLPSAVSFLAMGCALTVTAVLHGPASGRWYRTLNDIAIGTQLNIGLSIGFFFILVLGLVSARQGELIWLNTKTLYDHPLQVRKALGSFEADVLSIHRDMKDLMLIENEKDWEPVILDMEIRKKDAENQIVVLKKQYLGPAGDIVIIERDFTAWNALRAETIRLLRAGDKNAARARTMKNGVGGQMASRMLDDIRVVDEFAKNKAVQLYSQGEAQKSSLNRRLLVIIGIIVILAWIISWRLLKGIKEPLRHLAWAAEQLREGKLETRSSYVSANEFGILSDLFNSLAEVLAKRALIHEKTTMITSVMLRETEARNFCRSLITELVRQTDSCMGAVYLQNSETSLFEPFESVGLNTDRAPVFSPDDLDGEFGLALATGKVQRLRNIPDDTAFMFSTVAGGVKPREILTVPLLADNMTLAVLSLASLDGYSDESLSLIERILDILTARLVGVLSFRQIQALTEDLEERNSRLQTQQEELRVANEELEEQTQRLMQSEEELKAQQEELQVSNEELEEKTGLLIRQAQDIETARKKLEEKAGALAQASKYKSEFLANMSHELRTPLNSLLLLSQGLARNKEGNLTPDQVESARIIYNGGSELLNLINDILDLSKIEAGRIDLHFGAVRVTDLVGMLKDSFQHLCDEKGVELCFSIAKDVMPVIRSDSKRLGQILKNLVANAVKFTDKGRVTVSFGRPGDDAVLNSAGLKKDRCLAMSVNDTGIGIAPELQELIFDAFKQGDGSTSRKYGGTGLGLSISKELASLLGGEIQLQSTLGQGSVFTLYLPVEREASETARSHESAAPVMAVSPSAAPKIIRRPPVKRETPQDDRDTLGESDRIMLVIEDDDDFAKLLRKTCHEKGFRCLITETGEEGLELADRYLPSAVILDLGLPGMDGWAVLSALKENVKTRHIPVHIVSAEDASTKAIHKGAVGHATKPVNQDMLENTFKRLEQMTVGKPKRLLVVDDDALLRKETVKLIGNGDVTAFEAESGEAALAALRAEPFDCMVLDLGLPDMEGGELLRRLEREGIPVPPVVIYTARELTVDEEESIRERADSIVIKDVRSQERLLDEVSLFLHRVVSQMPEHNRKVIQSLHDTDAVFKDRKILVVDDDMRTTFAVSRLLAEKGAQPFKADNGERALRLLDEHPSVDMVLMDIMMPVMDGYETMRKIRSQDRFKNLPIIALTAKAMPEHQARCLEAGASDYLPKPIDEGRLFSMMRVWLCR